MGFEELNHTADWALRVWADDLPGLFSEAARGMNSLAGARLTQEPRTKRSLELDAADAEGLLVAFLSELIYHAEQENRAYDQFEISIQDNHLHAQMTGARLASLSKVIKAVTYHNLKIRQMARGYEVEIVFDV